MIEHRATRVGRRPGHQDTRGQILTAARNAFAARGFAGASVRGIAAEAGVDAALIHHYFATKQQLFLATVALPAKLPELISRATAGDADGVGERIVTTILQLWDSDLQPALVGAIRTAMAEPTLARSIGEYLSLEVLGRLPHPPDLDPVEAERRTGLVASQVLGLIVGRYVLALPALTDRPSAQLVAEVGPTIQRYLDPHAS